MWPVALSGRLPVVALVGHHPTNKLIGREPIPSRKTFQPRRCLRNTYPVLAPVSRGYSRARGRLLTCYSPVRHSVTFRRRCVVRLACVKHAASVRPEPGSNSPLMSISEPHQPARTTDTQKRTPPKQGNLAKTDVHSSSAIPKESHHEDNHKGRPRTGFVGIDFWHAVEFSRNGRTPTRPPQPRPGQPCYSTPPRAPGANPGGHASGPRGPPGDRPPLVSVPPSRAVAVKIRAGGSRVKTVPVVPALARPVVPALAQQRRSRAGPSPNAM